jgi:hypothetical protein
MNVDPGRCEMRRIARQYKKPNKSLFSFRNLSHPRSFDAGKATIRDVEVYRSLQARFVNFSRIRPWQWVEEIVHNYASTPRTFYLTKEPRVIGLCVVCGKHNTDVRNT